MSAHLSHFQEELVVFLFGGVCTKPHANLVGRVFLFAQEAAGLELGKTGSSAVFRFVGGMGSDGFFLGVTRAGWVGGGGWWVGRWGVVFVWGGGGRGRSLGEMITTSPTEFTPSGRFMWGVAPQPPYFRLVACDNSPREVAVAQKIESPKWPLERWKQMTQHLRKPSS